MDELKGKIQQQLISNIIKDKCAHNTYLVFDESNCVADRVIRFRTKFTIRNFNKFLYYEILNQPNNISVRLTLATRNMPKKFQNPMLALFRIYLIQIEPKLEYYIKEWELSNSDDINIILNSVDAFLDKTLKEYENDLEFKFDASLSKISFEMHEGTMMEILSTKYERNPKARQACIDANGAYCHICGFDFGKFYGKEFSDKIEVHHIVPISQIKADYVVNPIKDLIPICPNCHLMIHSKPNGVYTPSELKKILGGKP